MVFKCGYKVMFIINEVILQLVNVLEVLFVVKVLVVIEIFENDLVFVFYWLKFWFVVVVCVVVVVIVLFSLLNEDKFFFE